MIDDGAVAALVAAGTDVADAEIAPSQRARTAPTTWRRSSTRPAPPAGPKGVELTHGNFVALTRNGVAGLGEVCAQPDSRTLLFMPLAHVFARFIQVLCVPSGAVLGHTPDAKSPARRTSAAFQPTFILAVPRVFEKVYNSAEQKAGSGTKLKLFRWAAKAAEDYSRALETGGPGAALRARHALAGRLVHAQAARGAGRPRGVRRSPAVPRWASGSGTSTAASASRSSRATASPRPPRRRP